MSGEPTTHSDIILIVIIAYVFERESVLLTMQKHNCTYTVCQCTVHSIPQSHNPLDTNNDIAAVMNSLTSSGVSWPVVYFHAQASGTVYRISIFASEFRRHDIVIPPHVLVENLNIFPVQFHQCVVNTTVKTS